MSNQKKKIIRITTVPGSLTTLLKGQGKFISNYFDIVGISSRGRKNQLQNWTEREGIRAIPIEMTRKITPIKDVIAVVKIYKTLKKEKPFIVHSHTPKAGTLGMLAAKLAGVPHRLHTIAGLPLVETNGLKRTILVLVEKLTYSCATKIYPNSFGLKKIILDENFTKESKLKVIGNGSSNGIDTNYFKPNLYNDLSKKSLKEELKINKDDFVFIFVGRLVKDKGLNELIHAFHKLNQEYKSIKLLLLGGYENELDPLSAETLKRIQTNNNIITTGWVNDVRPYFAISDVLTFPSYREGFPNVVLQAGAMELACIVSDINGCNEIIEDNVTGYIIPKKDTQALYEALIYVLSNQDKTIKMGEKSRKNIVNNYEQKVVWEAILKEYNQLS